MPNEKLEEKMSTKDKRRKGVEEEEEMLLPGAAKKGQISMSQKERNIREEEYKKG